MPLDNENLQALSDIFKNGITLPIPKVKFSDYPELTKPIELVSPSPIFAQQAEQLEQIKNTSQAQLAEITRLRVELRIKEQKARKNKWKERLIGALITITCALIVFCITNLTKVIMFFKSLMP